MSNITTPRLDVDPPGRDDELYADEIGFSPANADEPPAEVEQTERDDSGTPFGRSEATIAAEVCETFLAPDRREQLRRAAPRRVADRLLGLINAEIARENGRLKNGEIVGRSLRPMPALGFAQLAALVCALDQVVAIAPSSRSTDPDDLVIAAYDDDPDSPHYGTYRASQSAIFERVARYRADVDSRGCAEIYTVLRRDVPRVTRGQNRDLLAVRNGVIDYNGGDPIFMDFSPEYVFLSKLDVDWNPEATNVVIHNDQDGTDWDVESWMSELSDDPEIVNLFWEIIGATVRPYVSWNKAAFFFATSGNNGKGTLLSLMRNILGVSNYASIPLSDFSRDFMLEPLLRASAILVDENDVGSYIDRSANLKAVITNDVITINGKFKRPIAHQHFGFMVQCLNDKPTIKDKSESFYRRQLFVPFTKSFTGMERKYIKDDYLTRPEVLEYVLKRVLEMNYYSLSEPEAVKAALEDFKESNDPVRAFWNEVKYQFSWDLVPFQFAYDLYRSWLERNIPQAKAIGRDKFRDELIELVSTDVSGIWECPDKSKRHRPGSRMAAPELLIVEFELQDWMNLSAPANNPIRRATMNPSQIKAVYRGLVRRDQSSAGSTLVAATAAQKQQRVADASEQSVQPEPAAAPVKPARAMLEQWVPEPTPGTRSPVPPSIAESCQIKPAYDE